MSHDHSTRFQGIKRLNWVFYDPSRSDTARIFEPHLYRIQEDDSEKWMIEWVPQAFADDIRKRYGFNINERAIQVAKPNTAVDILSVNRRWAKNITDAEESFQIIPQAYTVQELLDMLEITKHPNRLHLVVMGERAAEHKAEDETEDEDVVRDINQTFSRYRNALKMNSKPPSTAAKSGEYKRTQANSGIAIYDGRNEFGDGSTVAPPIHIFHPIFETFTRFINDPNLQPPASFVQETRELMRSASTIAQTESDKVEQICNKLSPLIGQFLRGSDNPDKTSADAVGFCDIGGIAAPFAIMEVKRECGETGYDPAIQASFSFQRHWQQVYASTVRERCCCPSFMLVAGGPWFCVLGGVFTDKCIVQRLTDLMWTAQSSMYEDARIQKTARVFYALKSCLQDLKAYYATVKDLPVEIPPPTSELKPLNRSRFFPYTTSFTQVDLDSGEERTWKFKYLGALENCSACITYRAEIVDVPRAGEAIVVKFVTRYGEEVHRFLEESGHAPKLHYFGPLRDGGNSIGNIWPDATIPFSGLHFGPLRMAVMEYIRPSDAPQDSGKQISDVVQLLHNNGFVFGDLRSPNVLFDANGKVKFIDFDWAGRYDRSVSDDDLSSGRLATQEDGTYPFARYPLGLSRSENQWARPVKELELNLIRPSHDIAMLEKHFKGPF